MVWTNRDGYRGRGVRYAIIRAIRERIVTDVATRSGIIEPAIAAEGERAVGNPGDERRIQRAVAAAIVAQHAWRRHTELQTADGGVGVCVRGELQAVHQNI